MAVPRKAPPGNTENFSSAFPCLRRLNKCFILRAFSTEVQSSVTCFDSRHRRKTEYQSLHSYI